MADGIESGSVSGDSWTKWTPPGNLFGQAAGDFDGETRFSDAAGAGDGYEANAGA